jgi:hypothetical protein
MIDRVVFYYFDTVKEKKIKTNTIIMRTETSPDYLNNRFTKEVEEQFNISGDLLSQAIENADGVPYQLTFGTGIGDGFFLNVGFGVKRLFGISPEEFTEMLFQQMIEEIIPGSEDIPVDPLKLVKKLSAG